MLHGDSLFGTKQMFIRTHLGGGWSEKKYGLYMCENVDNYGCPVRGTNHAQITEINII